MFALYILSCSAITFPQTIHGVSFSCNHGKITDICVAMASKVRRRNFTPRQHFQPKGGVNKPSSGHGKGKFKPKPPGPPTCYGCGEKGHIRSNCPNELKTAMFTSAASLPVHANSFAALAEVRNAELSADASMLSEPSPDSWQDLKERYYALIADLTPEWRDAIFGPGRNSHDPYVGEEGSISAQSNMVTAVGTVDVQSNNVTAVAAASAQSNMVTAVGAVDAQSNKVTAVAAASSQSNMVTAVGAVGAQSNKVAAVAAATATTGVGSRSEDLAALDALIASVSASDAPARADDGKASEKQQRLAAAAGVCSFSAAGVPKQQSWGAAKQQCDQDAAGGAQQRATAAVAQHLNPFAADDELQISPAIFAALQ
ncbi:hypothetical protein COO60DRAFT_1626398, partial [Scenedesmus sp. NREL 46B-D3]